MEDDKLAKENQALKKKCKGLELRVKNGDDQIGNLQRKLDSFWERQELEK